MGLDIGQDLARGELDDSAGSNVMMSPMSFAITSVSGGVSADAGEAVRPRTLSWAKNAPGIRYLDIPTGCTAWHQWCY